MESLYQEEKKSNNQPLKEGLDYFIENRCWVFTEHYLRNRGWCCGSGCRHCPYGHEQGQTQPIEKPLTIS